MNGHDHRTRASEPRAEPTGEDATTPADDAAPPESPWHESRARRAGARGIRRIPKSRVRGATRPAPGTWAERLGAGRLRALRLPQIRPPLGRSWLPWVSGAVVLVWVGATSLHPVGTRQQAIVVTAGAWGPTYGPGLAVSWPWPIGSAVVEDVTSVRHLAMPDGEGEHLMLTRDGALIDVAYDVRWRVGNLRDHALALADPDATLRLAAENAMHAAVAGVDFAAPAGTDRDGLGHDAAQRLQALLDRDHAGIVVTGVDIRRADPPARVAEALRAVTAARGDAQTEALQAHSWAHQWVLTAQGEAGEFDRVYDEYRHAPDVIRRQMYYATMERVLAQSDKVLVDAPGTTVALPPVTPAKPANDGAANGH